jgi:hypothetical protein
LLYVVLGTASWISQTTSTLLSHEALLKFQRQHRRAPRSPAYKRSFLHSIICALAVITRQLGRALAVINALWILAWCIMSYTNVMETPYCTTAVFSRHQYGWMRLWNFDSEQFVNTKMLELRCLVFGSVIAFCACVAVFFLTSEWNSWSMKNESDAGSWSERLQESLLDWAHFKNWQWKRRTSSFRYRYEFVLALIAGFAMIVAILAHFGFKGVRDMP